MENIKMYMNERIAFKANKTPSAADLIVYFCQNALYQAEGDTEKASRIAWRKVRKAFKPRTNRGKINAVGGDRNYGLRQALRRAKFQAREDEAVCNVIEGVSSALDRKYVYIFVRQDISPEYQLVQAAHVTYVAGQHATNASEQYFCVIGVKDEMELYEVEKKLGADTYKFFEPDIGGELTALCTKPRNDRETFEKYRLLRFK